MPIRDLRVRATKECKALGVEPGEMSLLFRAMETVVKPPMEPLRADQDGPRSFNLTLNDLRNLEQALDQIKDVLTGAQLYLPAEFIATSVTEPGKRGRSVTHTELKKWHELAVLDQLRRCRRSERIEAHNELERAELRNEVDNVVGSDPPAVGSDRSVELGHSRVSGREAMEVDDGPYFEESEDDLPLDAGPPSSPLTDLMVQRGPRRPTAPTPPATAAAVAGAVSSRPKRTVVEESSQSDQDAFEPYQESEGVEEEQDEEEEEGLIEDQEEGVVEGLIEEQGEGAIEGLDEAVIDGLEEELEEEQDKGPDKGPDNTLGKGQNRTLADELAEHIEKELKEE